MRLLGACNFFAKFVISYAGLVAPLYDMVKDTFDWSGKFDLFKLAILNSIKITYSDHTKTMILITDASATACAGVLIQVGEGGIYECIALESRKFSDLASRWGIDKKECFAIYWSIMKMS